MSNAVETPVEPDVVVAPPEPFATVPAEGPYGFKPDRNRPIEPHFDGFGRLTPDQARQVLDVRDGRQPQCVLHLPTETVLVEHCGQGYSDPVTGVQWGYRIRRVGRDEPVAPQPVEPPPSKAVLAVDVPLVLEGSRPVDPYPITLSEWTMPDPSVVVPDEMFDVPAVPEPEPEDEWSAPARSSRAVALADLADPAERSALVRVLVLWFVVVLLLAECVTLLATGR